MNMWARCVKCNHKLFLINESIKDGESSVVKLQIKCSSCKRIQNIIMRDGVVFAVEVKDEYDD